VFCVFALALLLPSGSFAGTLPNISGTWYALGNASKRCDIDQSGNSVTFHNAQGQAGRGFFVNPSVVQVDWGYAGGRALRATISADLQRIDWSNGTYWTRASRYVPAATPTPDPYRPLQFVSERSADAGGPIKVIDGWGVAARNGKGGVVCVSFQNRGALTATRVVFEFSLLDRNGATVDTMRLDRHGEFAPNVEIRGWDSSRSWQAGVGHRGYTDNCANLQLDVAARSILAARTVEYHIARVEFSGGTVWP
jgi:hypothetical protein